MLVRWSTVKHYAEGVYDVWYACPHCGYAAWARAKGAGLGSDPALYVKASPRAAAINATVAANHDAERLVHASPCPRCNGHHPQILAWEDAYRGASPKSGSSV